MKTINGIIILTIILATLLLIPISSAEIYQIQPDTYIDYLGQSHVLTSSNLIEYPLYTLSETETTYIISRFGQTVSLPKRNWIEYNFMWDRIEPTYIISSYSQIEQLVVKNSPTIWYLKFPWSASQVKSVTDKMIDMGVFRRNIDLSVTDSNTSSEFPKEYQIVPKVVSGDIRLYFNPKTYSEVVYPLYIQEHTIYVDNSTTSGWSSTNITLVNSTKDLSSENVSVGFLWDTFDDGIIDSSWYQIGTSIEANGYLNITLMSGTRNVLHSLSYTDFNESVDMKTIRNSIMTTNVPRLSYLYSLNSNNITNVMILQITNGIKTEIYYNGTQEQIINETFAANRFNWNTLRIYTINDTTYFWVNNTPRDTLTLNNISLLKQLSSLKTGMSVTNMEGWFDNFRAWQNNTGEIYMWNVGDSIKTMNRTRVVLYNIKDSLTSDLYYRINDTTEWTLLKESVVSDEWYNLTSPTNLTLDFKIILNGNESESPVFNSIEVDYQQSRLSGYVVDDEGVEVSDVFVSVSSINIAGTDINGYYETDYIFSNGYSYLVSYSKSGYNTYSEIITFNEIAENANVSLSRTIDQIATETLQSNCASNSTTFASILSVFSVVVMIFSFGFVLLQFKSAQSGERDINPQGIIFGILTGIIAFGMLTIGNYLIYAIMNATGC